MPELSTRGQILVDVDEAVAKEIAKRDRKITKQKAQIDDLTAEVTNLRLTLGKLKRVKDAVVEAADLIDPYRYGDDDG